MKRVHRYHYRVNAQPFQNLKLSFCESLVLCPEAVGFYIIYAYAVPSECLNKMAKPVKVPPPMCTDRVPALPRSSATSCAVSCVIYALLHSGEEANIQCLHSAVQL